MFEKRSNPDCGLPFDYREGRLIRSAQQTHVFPGPTIAWSILGSVEIAQTAMYSRMNAERA
jgi:hypothetical protein